MKVTTDKIMDTIIGGFLHKVLKTAEEIGKATEHATKDQPVILGSHVYLAPRNDLTSNYILITIMLSLMMDEIEAIKRIVKSLTKRKPGDAART